MSLMPIEHVPDWEKRLARQDAFWAGQIIDRPVVTFGLPKKQPDPAIQRFQSASVLLFGNRAGPVAGH